MSMGVCLLLSSDKIFEYSKVKELMSIEDEYKRRHEALWPRLKQFLKSKGISEYSISLGGTMN